MQNMSNAEKQKWLNHIKQRSERSRDVIRYWLARAKLAMLDRRRKQIKDEKASSGNVKTSSDGTKKTKES